MTLAGLRVRLCWYSMKKVVEAPFTPLAFWYAAQNWTSLGGVVCAVMLTGSLCFLAVVTVTLTVNAIFVLPPSPPVAQFRWHGLYASSHCS
jgi:hypothetical protein